MKSTQPEDVEDFLADSSSSERIVGQRKSYSSGRVVAGFSVIAIAVTIIVMMALSLRFLPPSNRIRH